MGKVVKVECRCGYGKELYIGSGLKSNDKDYVREVFSKAELLGFEAADKESIIKSIFVENYFGVCEECSEIVTVPVLLYKTDEDENMISRSCEICEKPVKLTGKTITCPKCGNRLAYSQTGQWE
jgi:hypothetical protein